MGSGRQPCHPRCTQTGGPGADRGQRVLRSLWQGPSPVTSSPGGGHPRASGCGACCRAGGCPGEGPPTGLPTHHVRPGGVRWQRCPVGAGVALRRLQGGGPVGGLPPVLGEVGRHHPEPRASPVPTTAGQWGSGHQTGPQAVLGCSGRRLGQPQGTGLSSLTPSRPSVFVRRTGPEAPGPTVLGLLTVGGAWAGRAPPRPETGPLFSPIHRHIKAGFMGTGAQHDSQPG